MEVCRRRSKKTAAPDGAAEFREETSKKGSRRNHLLRCNMKPQVGSVSTSKGECAAAAPSSGIWLMSRRRGQGPATSDCLEAGGAAAPDISRADAAWLSG